MFTRAVLAGAVVAATAVGFFCGAAAQAAPVVFPSSAGGNDNAYEVIVDGGATYPAAQSAATAAGGHLLSITSSAEQSFVESLLLGSGAPTGSYYTALERTSIDGFKWSTGEPFEFQNFAGGEPNNFMGTELVGQIYWTDDVADDVFGRRGTWNDSPVDGYAGADVLDLNRAGFVIEISSDGTGNEESPVAIPLPLAAMTGPVAALLGVLVTGAGKRRTR
jgi:hypothetical protein